MLRTNQRREEKHKRRRQWEHLLDGGHWIRNRVTPTVQQWGVFLDHRSGRHAALIRAPGDSGWHSVVWDRVPLVLLRLCPPGTCTPLPQCIKCNLRSWMSLFKGVAYASGTLKVLLPSQISWAWITSLGMLCGSEKRRNLGKGGSGPEFRPSKYPCSPRLVNVSSRIVRWMVCSTQMESRVQDCGDYHLADDWYWCLKALEYWTILSIKWIATSSAKFGVEGIEAWEERKSSENVE